MGTDQRPPPGREPGHRAAERIPNATLVELPGDEHIAFLGDSDAVLDEIQEFLTGVRHPAEFDRALATVDLDAPVAARVIQRMRARPTWATVEWRGVVATPRAARAAKGEVAERAVIQA